MLFNNVSNIIKNQELLSIDYVPKNIVGRDPEIKELVFQLSYLFKEYPSLPNFIVYGSVGTGKTTCINHVLSELEKSSKEKEINLKIVKVKCSESKTKYEVLKKIYSQISSDGKMPNTSSDIYNEIVKKLCVKGLYLLIFLDEAHELKDGELNNTLYTISRLGGDICFSDFKPKELTESKKSNIGYIIVSNDPNLRNKLKDNTKSSLTRENMIFKRYEPGEIVQILQSRIDNGAIYEEKIEIGVLEYISGVSVNQGQDARYGLILLNNVAKECEKRNCKQITIKLTEEVNDILLQDYMKSLLRDQPRLYLDILCIIYQLHKSNRPINSKVIYDEYVLNQKFDKVNYSRISQVITSMEKDSILYVTHSKKTKLRNLSIQENLDEIEEVLKEKGYEL